MAHYKFYIVLYCIVYVVVRPAVCLSSVTFMHPTQATEIFGNVSRDVKLVFFRNRSSSRDNRLLTDHRNQGNSSGRR